MAENIKNESRQTGEVTGSLFGLGRSEGELDAVVEGVEACVDGSAAADDAVAMQSMDLEGGMRHGLARRLPIRFFFFEVLTVAD